MGGFEAIYLSKMAATMAGPNLITDDVCINEIEIK